MAMAIYNFESIDDGNFRINGTPYPSIYLARQYGSDDQMIQIVEKDNRGAYLLGISNEKITGIAVNGRNDWTCAEELQVVLNSEIKIGGAFKSGNGGSGVAVPDEFFFADTTARDDYFNANPDKKKEGVQIVVDGELEEWDGANWIDMTAVVRGERGSQGEKGEKGEKGDQGIQGVRGEKGDPGRDGIDGQQGIQGMPGENAVSNIQYRGTYDNSTTYIMNDVVVGNDGNAYALTTESQVGVDPPGDNWALFVMKGAPGEQGVPGQQGVPGNNGLDGKTYISGEIPDFENQIDIKRVIPPSVSLSTGSNLDPSLVPNDIWVADEDCFVALRYNAYLSEPSAPYNLIIGLSKNGMLFARDYYVPYDSMNIPGFIEPQRVSKGDIIGFGLNVDYSRGMTVNQQSFLILVKYPIISSTKEDFINLEATKQDKLIAGENINIDPNTNIISATGDISMTVHVDGTTITGDGTEENPLVAVGGGGGGSSLPQLLSESLNPQGDNDVAIRIMFSGDTTEIMQNMVLGSTFTTFYSEDENSTAYEAVLPKSAMDGGARVVVMFIMADSGNLVWMKNYSPSDFGLPEMDVTVDDAPTEGSTNFVTSGGVYEAIKPSEGVAYKTINLTDVKVGDDLSGATINFNPNNLPMFLNPDAGLSGFQWVVWSGTSGAGINISVAWNANSIQDGALNNIYSVPSGDLTVPNWLEDTYTFPENTVITEMYDLGGNRQNWDDVVVGCDPSGWNPSMATVSIPVQTVNIGSADKAINLVGTDIYINGESIDETPVKDSTNIVTSGGIWSDTHYVVSSGPEQKTLADVVLGEDMSNVMLDFTSSIVGSLVTTPEIIFTNGARLGLSTDNQTWALWDSGGTRISPELFVTGLARETEYTIPDGYVVSAISDNNADSPFSQAIRYTSSPVETVISFRDHVENDTGYWQVLQQVQNQLGSMQALMMKLQMDNNDLKARVAILEEEPVPGPDPVYDMSSGQTLHTPPLLGALGLSILGIDKIGTGWTAPTDGLLVVDNASVIGLLNPDEWIAVNGNKADPSGSPAVLELLNGTDSAQIALVAGDFVTQSGMGNITFYKRIA